METAHSTTFARARLGIVLGLACMLLAKPARAVQPVFDPSGSSFFDLPFPYESRRDPDGTVSIAGFPFPANDLVQQYAAAIELSPGFGIASGVFFKFDGDIDSATLPATPDASRQPGASVFLIDIDPASPARGTRVPLWLGFHATADAYRDAHLLTLLPAAGQVLAQGTLYAAVVTDALHDTTGAPLTVAPLVQRMQAGTPQGAFEAAALPLFRKLWTQLERREGLTRGHVVTATVFRTGSPAASLERVARFVRRHYRPAPSAVQLDVSRSGGNYFVLRGTVVSPQFQKGTPPFVESGTGAFVFDAAGDPVVQRNETLEFVLAVPKAVGPAGAPRSGWPIAQVMHGTGGSRFSFLNDRTAERLAAVGVASLSFDQPLHGLRPGGPGDNFYNPLYPLAFRDNTRQAAVDGFIIDHLIARLRFDAPTLGVPAMWITRRRIDFDIHDRLFFGHSQGATVGPLFLAFARGVRGGVLSAGGGDLLLNILTVDNPSIGGLTNKQLAEALLGTTLDLFHPFVHLLQMGAEMSDPLAYVDRFAKNRGGRPLSVLFTHGMLDPEVTTPLTTSMVAAAGYPLVEPTFPNRLFPALPDFDYHDIFTLAGLPTLTPPVRGNLVHRRRAATGGLVLFELGDHFPAFHDPDAIAQWTEFMRSLAYDPPPTIPARP